jgi:hypothetical protein
VRTDPPISSPPLLMPRPSGPKGHYCRVDLGPTNPPDLDPPGRGPREPRDHEPRDPNGPQERTCNLAQRVAERVADSSADVGNAATDVAIVSLAASAIAARQGNIPGALLALQLSGRAGAVATAFGGISAAASLASGNNPRVILNQTTSFLAKKLLPFVPDAVRDKITAPLEQEGQRCAR